MKVWHLHKGIPFMFDLIRKLLFSFALILIVVAAYNIYTKYSPLSNLPVKVHLSENGADIEIDKFKVIHEVSGKKDWELKADHAEVDHKKQLTLLRNVELEFRRSADQKYWVSAEKGILNNQTKDFQLEGGVRLIAQSKSLVRKFQSQEKGNPVSK